MKPKDIPTLPSSKGAYLGSIIYDEWTYYGSSESADHFVYKWNEGSFLKSKKLQIKPKVVDFAYPYSKKTGVAVKPVYKSNQQVSFERIESATTKFNNKALDKSLSEN